MFKYVINCRYYNQNNRENQKNILISFNETNITYPYVSSGVQLSFPFVKTIFCIRHIGKVSDHYAIECAKLVKSYEQNFACKWDRHIFFHLYV